MKPEKVTFFAYADSPEEVRQLEEALYKFVSGLFSQGRIVSCRRLCRALDAFSNLPIVKNYFNGYN